MEATPIDEDALILVEEAIRDVLPEGEMIVHFDILVETRVGPEARKIRFRRLSPAGSNPLLSLGLLQACLAQLSLRLGLTGDPTGDRH